jgi:hypothetical protein
MTTSLVSVIRESSCTNSRALCEETNSDISRSLGF